MKRMLVFLCFILLGFGTLGRTQAASSKPDNLDMSKNFVPSEPIVLKGTSIDMSLYLKSETIKAVRDCPGRKLEEHSFNPASKLVKRVSFKPDGILAYLRIMDGREKYTHYQPLESELKDIEKSLDALPLKLRKLFQERLVKIYFVNDFLGSGFADFLLDRNGKMYFYLVFNPSVLKKTLSQWAAHKEESCFIKQKGFMLKIKADNALSGFFGVLLHESAHIYDYANNVTPYVEPVVIPLMENRKKDHSFTKENWAGYLEHSSAVKFSWLSKISFYGQRGGPHITMDKALGLYRQLSSSPFVSLYSVLNWAEDFAEFFMLYHLVEVLKSPYRIEVLKDGKLLHAYEPFKSPLQKKRLAWMKDLYE